MSYKPVNHSHLTAKPRTKLSYPMRWLHKQNLFKGRILDFGCGLGSDVKLLSSLGYDIIGYDNFGTIYPAFRIHNIPYYLLRFYI